MGRNNFPWKDGCTPEESSMLEHTIKQALNQEEVVNYTLQNPFTNKNVDIDKIAHYVLSGKEREKIDLSTIQTEHTSKSAKSQGATSSSKKSPSKPKQVLP